MSILVVGSANVDHVFSVDRLPVPGETIKAGSFSLKIGGKGVNQAVAAARAGGSVIMAACVGDDQGGQMIRAALAADAIVADPVSVLPGPSGVAMVMTETGGDNMIALAPGANALFQPSMLDAEQFMGSKLVLCQLEIPLETVLHAVRLAGADGATVILDPAPAQPLPEELLSRVDWLTPNESEARILLGRSGRMEPAAVARAIRDMGVRNVLLKLGSRGSLLLCEDGDPIAIAPHEVVAVDSTAAGDAFNGAFAVALGEGATPEAAARFASAASALAVTRHGASDAMAYRQEIDGAL